MRAGRGAAILVLVVLGAAAIGMDRSGAAFTATSANPGSQLSSAGTFGGSTSTTGVYTGNGVDDRTIDGLGFSPAVVTIKAVTAQPAVIRVAAQGGGDISKRMDTSPQGANQIQSLDPDGFSLGTAATVNSSGVTYHWLAYRELPGVIDVGTYTGNGSSSRAITGAGFSPDYVAVVPTAAQAPVERFTGMSASFRFDSGAGSSNGIRSLDSNGFTVGNNAAVNASGATFSYIALNEVPGIEVGSYSGNGADNRSITAVGFRPDWVTIRSSDTSSRMGIHRGATLTGDASQSFSATPDAANQIQRFEAGGFQLGSDVNVNRSGITHYYLAVLTD